MKRFYESMQLMMRKIR